MGIMTGMIMMMVSMIMAMISMIMMMTEGWKYLRNSCGFTSDTIIDQRNFHFLSKVQQCDKQVESTNCRTPQHTSRIYFVKSQYQIHNYKSVWLWSPPLSKESICQVSVGHLSRWASHWHSGGRIWVPSPLGDEYRFFPCKQPARQEVIYCINWHGLDVCKKL